MTTSQYIIDTTDQQFSEDVILKSDEMPVLVDFWAPWCGPCKMLAPVLEEVAAHFDGNILIAKLNTDENPALAQHFQIRGIPALKLIKNREVVYETGGVQPIASLIEAITPFVNSNEASAPTDTEIQKIDNQEQTPSEKLEQLQVLLDENKDDPVLQSQFIQALVANDKLEQAFEHFQSLNKEIQDSEAGLQTKIFLDFARTQAEAPDVSALEKIVKNDVRNLTARYQLAVHKLLDGQSAAALEDLLFIIKTDKTFEEGLGRKAMVAAFSLLDDETLIKNYRTRMANYLH